MALFDDIMDSINELMEDAQGKSAQPLKRHRLAIANVDTFTPSEIKQTRVNANMTQWMFAMVIGVTPKAVEAWEGGRSRPDGAARRIIGLMAKNPKFADDMGIVLRETNEIPIPKGGYE